jgi:hypothetical protein
LGGDRHSKSTLDTKYVQMSLINNIRLIALTPNPSPSRGRGERNLPLSRGWERDAATAAG